MTNSLCFSIVFQSIFMVVVWGLPTFTVIYQYMQMNDLPLGLSISFNIAIYFSPISLFSMAIMSSYQEVVLQHQNEIISRIKLACNTMLSILKDENLNGMEARKNLARCTISH